MLLHRLTSCKGPRVLDLTNFITREKAVLWVLLLVLWQGDPQGWGLIQTPPLTPPLSFSVYISVVTWTHHKICHKLVEFFHIFKALYISELRMKKVVLSDRIPGYSFLTNICGS